MSPEQAGGGELAELVTDHRLAHEDRHVLAAVVHGDRVADHLGEDRRRARPRLHHLLRARRVHALDPLDQALLDPRALLGRSRHKRLPLALPATPPAHDHAVRRLVLLARGVAERRHAPRGDRVTTGRGRALAAAVRMVDGVHRRAARLRADALVAAAAGLSDRDVLVLRVADRADRRAAVDRHHAHLAGRQAQRGAVAFLRDELDRGAGAAPHLAALAGGELDVVHGGAGRDQAQRQAVADGDVGALAGLDGHAHTQAVRREDVALVAVGVVDQRDVGGAIRVVLDRGHARRHAVLLALEVDHAVLALGAAAAVARRDAPVRVAPARLLESGGERLLGL